MLLLAAAMLQQLARAGKVRGSGGTLHRHYRKPARRRLTASASPSQRRGNEKLRGFWQVEMVSLDAAA